MLLSTQTVFTLPDPADVPTGVLIAGGVVAWYLMAAAVVSRNSRVRGFLKEAAEIKPQVLWALSPIAFPAAVVVYVGWTALWVMSVGIVERPFLPPRDDDNYTAAQTPDTPDQMLRRDIRRLTDAAYEAQRSAGQACKVLRAAAATYHTSYRRIRVVGTSPTQEWVLVDPQAVIAVAPGETGQVLLYMAGRVLMVYGLSPDRVLTYLYGHAPDPGYAVKAPAVDPKAADGVYA